MKTQRTLINLTRKALNDQYGVVETFETTKNVVRTAFSALAPATCITPYVTLIPVYLAEPVSPKTVNP